MRTWLLLDLVFPTRCFCCGVRLAALSAHGACPQCWLDLVPLPDDPKSSEYMPVRCAVEYTQKARRFLLRAKFGPRRELFGPMAQMLSAVLRRVDFDPTCVVPVPSHPWATLRRGFSPGMELALPLARSLRVPIRRAVRRRWVPRTPVKRLSRAERLRWGKDLFRIASELRGESVLLVDDLTTTGTTLRSCGTLCRQAGATRVVAVVWAKTLARF